MEEKKVYFIADLHLGSRANPNAEAQERALVNWLDSIKYETSAIYFLGDVFDFWFEYREVIPKGYVRFLGKLSELIEKGVKIHWILGNHDIWAKEYLTREIGIILHRKPITCKILGKKFFLAHGDEFLTQADRGYGVLYSLFHNSLLQAIFSWIHPDLSVDFALRWAKNGRDKVKRSRDKIEKQILPMLAFAKEYAQDHSIDYFVMGHLHIPYKEKIEGKAQFFLLDSCMEHISYGVFDGEEFCLQTLENSYES